jgi:hypothetical protein
MAHGIVPVHGKGVRLCRGSFLCRALASPFAMRLVFVVRSNSVLPWVFLCRAFGGAFTVRVFAAVRCCQASRESRLCRAMAHGRVGLYGSFRFSGTVSI